MAVCDRCDATYDLQTLPSETRQDALTTFITSHAYCKEDVGKRSANTITIRQQTALTLFATLLANNEDGKSTESLAENAVDAARVFCQTLSAQG